VGTKTKKPKKVAARNPTIVVTNNDRHVGPFSNTARIFSSFILF